MKITVDYSESDTNIIKIENVIYLGDFVFQLKFNDGAEKNIDFKPFFQKTRNPSIKKYYNEKNFLNYKIIDGNLNWNDYDLIFPIWELYNGSIS